MEFLDLFNSLLPKAAKWESLGLQLGLSPDELATIKANSEDVEECLRRVLIKWFHRTVQPTWQEVAAALRSPGLEDHRLAVELEQKYCLQDTRKEDQHGKSMMLAVVHNYS